MLSLMIVTAAMAVTPPEEAPMLKFEKERIGDVTYEAASAFDVDNDGVMDIVSGEYWFKGPDFKTQYKICSLRKEGDYYDDFADYPMDVNGDGFIDIVSGGWFGESLTWRENPKGQTTEWQVHEIAKVGNVERPAFYDMDKDGHVEVIPNCPSMPVSIFKLVRDAAGKGTGKFEQYTVSEGAQGHGIGFGDINGDGRPDIVLWNGWLEAPENPYGGGLWTFHKEFELVKGASVPILVHDVNGDGLNDLIVGDGHDYAFDWWEQKKDANGNRTWIKHEIDTERSQYHEMQLVDIDNDGELELVTGKRYYAHQTDPGAEDPVGIYYFKINGGNFKRYTISYGPKGEGKGAGIYFWVEDLNGNGWKDVVAPGKDGLCLFRNLGK